MTFNLIFAEVEDVLIVIQLTMEPGDNFPNVASVHGLIQHQLCVVELSRASQLAGLPLDIPFDQTAKVWDQQILAGAMHDWILDTVALQAPLIGTALPGSSFEGGWWQLTPPAFLPPPTCRPPAVDRLERQDLAVDTNLRSSEGLRCASQPFRAVSLLIQYRLWRVRFTPASAAPGLGLLRPYSRGTQPSLRGHPRVRMPN
jgi:hypothetical protein